MAPLKVGLIGYGFSTKCFHLPFITPNKDLEVYAFLQRAEAPAEKSGVEKGKHCTIDYPKAKHYRTPEDFFGDKEIELVVVCSGGLHTEFAEQAMRAGKHVVVEKPFTITSEQSDSLIKTAKETGKVCTPFQNRRYDSDFLTLRSLIATGALGEITDFTTHYDVDYPEWALKWTEKEFVQGQGMLYGLGTHSIDQTLLLFGQPKSVWATTRSLRGETANDDTFTVVLQYGGDRKNLVATVKTTIVSSLPTERQLKYFVRGRDGTFMKHGEDPQIDHLFADMPADDPKFGVEPESTYGELWTKKQVVDTQTEDDKTKLWGGKYESQQGFYVNFYKDVVASIKDGKAQAIKPEESRMGIRVIEMALESNRTGQVVAWRD
ncbi:hypothetical protein LTR95_015638 [Oleoguttula sp. CCFEE 5521]